MKQSLNNFEFWENFVIEKQIVDVLREVVGPYTISEILNNLDGIFDTAQNTLLPIIGFNIERSFFQLKNIEAQIRVARNAMNDLQGYICGGDVYYYIIQESADKKSIYLSYQWHSLFHEMVTIVDQQPRVRGLAKQKLLTIINQHFPQAERLLFRGDTEGTMKMFRNDGMIPVDGDPKAKWAIS